MNRHAAGFADGFYHLGFRLELGNLRSSHAEDVFFDDRAVEVIRAVAQRDLRQLHAETDPVRGDVIEVIEVDAADGDCAQGIKSGWRRLHRHPVVLGLIRERNESGEAAGFVLQRAELAQMIHAIGQRLHVAKEHRARAAPAHLMPGAMHVEILFRRFLALGDRGAHLLAEDFRAATRERIEASRLEFSERLFHGLLRQPGKMENLDRGEALELQPRVELFQPAQHVRVVAEG